MVGKLGKIAALFGSKASLSTNSAFPSTLTVCQDEDIQSEKSFRRSWSFRLSKKKKHHNRVSNGGKTGNESATKVRVTPALSATNLSTKIEQSLSTPQLISASVQETQRRQLASISHAAKGAEALAILVNYLVQNYEAFSVPQLKKDIEKLKTNWSKTKLELEESQIGFNRLQEIYDAEKGERDAALEEVYKECEEEKNELREKFTEEYDKLSAFHKEKLDEIRKDFESKESQLRANFTKEIEELKKSQAEQLDQLKRDKIKETDSLTKNFCKKLLEAGEREEVLQEKLEAAEAQYEEMRTKSQTFMNTLGKDAKLKISMEECHQLQSEVDSLRSVLELKTTELLELRRQSLVWRRDAEQLPQALGKVSSLQSQVAELKSRLESKELNEQKLWQENQLLNETIHKETTVKNRLSMHNEELQWKLKKNCQVAQALAALSGPATTSPTKVSRNSYALNKTASEADINSSRMRLDIPKNVPSHAEFTSSPGSPVVKSVIEKSDSVSWIFDIDEPPQCIASRIVKQAQARPPPQHKPRSRASKSLCYTVNSCPPSTKSVPPSRAADESWDEHVTEEVILVKSIGNQNVLELLNVDNAEIHIDDVPMKEHSEEEMEMIRRVEEPGMRAEVLIPKDSAGEAMISGEASDDEDDDGADTRDSTFDRESSEDDFTDKDSDHGGPNGPNIDLNMAFNIADVSNLDMSWSEDLEVQSES